jgi:hypothetical protein
MRFVEDFVLALEAWRTYPSPHANVASPWTPCRDGIERRYVLARVALPRHRGDAGATIPSPVRTRPPMFVRATARG